MAVAKCHHSEEMSAATEIQVIDAVVVEAILPLHLLSNFTAAIQLMWSIVVQLDHLKPLMIVAGTQMIYSSVH